MILTFPSPFAAAYLAACLVIGGCFATALMVVVVHLWRGEL